MLVAYDEPSCARVHLMLESIAPQARIYTTVLPDESNLPFPVKDQFSACIVVLPPYRPVTFQNMNAWHLQFPAIPLIVIQQSASVAQLAEWIGHGADEVLEYHSLTENQLYKAISLAKQRSRRRSNPVVTEDNYLSLFDDSPVSQWIYDAETLSFLLVNKTAIRRYGYSRAEFETLKITDIREPDENQRMLHHLGRMNREPGRFYDSGTWLHHNKAGELFYVKIYSLPIVFKGKPARMVMVIDTNEKELAQQQNAELLETLRLQKETMDAMLNTIEDGVWVNEHGNWTLRYCNRAYEKIIGYTLEEINSSPGLMRSIIDPDDLRKVEDAISRLDHSTDARLEFRITRKDGEQRTLLCSAITSVGENDDTILVYGTLIDITSVRQYKSELDHTSKALADIMERISDVFFTLDRDWNFTYVNRRFEERFNLDGKRLLGKYCWKYLDDDNVRLLKPALETVLKENRKTALQVYYEPIKIWLNITAYPTRDGLAVYCTDITTIMQQTDQLNRLHKNQSALINCTHDIIWSIDDSLNLISFNESFQKTVQELTGVQVQQGMRIRTNFFGAHEEERWKGYYERALNGESFRIELPFTLANTGRKIYTEMIFNPIRNGGEIIGVGCFGRDITYQVHQQQRIAKQLQHLRDISWQQSHVVRAPLARLMGLIHVLKVVHTPEETARYLDLLFQTASELDKVIQDTVKLADADSNR